MTMSISSAPASTAGPRLGELHVAERLAADGKPGRDAGDLHAAARERLLGVGDQRRVDADRRHGRDGRVARLGAHRLDAQRPDLARRVLPLEGRQVHHPDREVERPELRRPLDRAPLERVDPLLDPDLVDRADPADQAAERAADRARSRIPGPDQLVRALAGGAVGALGGGHGTERIHRDRRRVRGRASRPADRRDQRPPRALGAAACRACPRRGSGRTSRARSEVLDRAGTASPSASARGSPRAPAAAGPAAAASAGR